MDLAGIGDGVEAPVKWRVEEGSWPSAVRIVAGVHIRCKRSSHGGWWEWWQGLKYVCNCRCGVPFYSYVGLCKGSRNRLAAGSALNGPVTQTMNRYRRLFFLIRNLC